MKIKRATCSTGEAGRKTVQIIYFFFYSLMRENNFICIQFMHCTFDVYKLIHEHNMVPLVNPEKLSHILAESKVCRGENTLLSLHLRF